MRLYVALVHEWLVEARQRLADATGEPTSAYDLTSADVDTLLELARVAAHESGDRTNAPLLTYLAGLAHGLHGDRSLDELAAAAAGDRPSG